MAIRRDTCTLIFLPSSWGHSLIICDYYNDTDRHPALIGVVWSSSGSVECIQFVEVSRKMIGSIDSSVLYVSTA